MGMFGFTCSICGPPKDQFDYPNEAIVTIRVKDGFMRKKGTYEGYGYVNVIAYDENNKRTIVKIYLEEFREYFEEWKDAGNKIKYTSFEVCCADESYRQCFYAESCKKLYVAEMCSKEDPIEELVKKVDKVKIDDSPRPICICEGVTKKGKRCKKKVINNKYCYLHLPK